MLGEKCYYSSCVGQLIWKSNQTFEQVFITVLLILIFVIKINNVLFFKLIDRLFIMKDTTIFFVLFIVFRNYLMFLLKLLLSYCNSYIFPVWANWTFYPSILFI